MSIPRSLFAAIAACASLFVAVRPVDAQMSLDVPQDGVSVGQPFTIAGWAIDAAAPNGTGVFTVHVWAYPNPGSGAPGEFWGVATYGMPRPDVGAVFGNAFTNAGYRLSVAGHAPGVYQIVAFAASTVTNAFDQTRTATVTLVANPQMSLDSPANGATMQQPFAVAGWALDTMAGNGTGIDAIHVWAYPNPGSGAPGEFWGVGAYGGARPDVGAVFGSQFTNSAFGLTVTGHAPGVYQLVVFAHNTVANAWDSRAATIVVTDHPLMSNGVPLNGASVYQPFEINGWALDLAASRGAGVDAIDVWAYPNPGSGAEPVYWGAASYGVSRPDVGAIFGAQFTSAGYSLTVQGQPLGFYQVVVFARSTVSGTFNQAWSFTVTVGTAPRAMALDAPLPGAFVLQPIAVSGWAIDGAGLSGPGVDLVHVYAWPNPGSGAPAIFLGAATYGLARPDIAAAYGVRFTNSGFSLNASGLAPGTYQITAYPRSTASGVFNQAASAIVHVDSTATAPFLSPGPGTYVGPLSIFAVAATGATVRYTLDGSEPAESSFVASSPIPTFVSVTLKAKAFAPGMHPSPTVTAAYQVQVPTPTLTPPGGAYDAGQAVTMTLNYPATIRYSTDGSDPTSTHPVYTNPISLQQDTSIKARAFMAGALPSGITGASYSLRVARPVMVPAGGEFDAAPVVEISATPGATIRFTVDRSEPTSTSPVYSGPITTDGNTTIKAIAFKTGLSPSVVTTETYLTTAVVNTPGSSPASVTSPSVTTTAMNTAGGSVTFNVAGASLSSNPADTLVYRNGVRLPANAYTISPGGVTLFNALQDGENRLELEAIDSTGLLLNSTVSAWAGNRTLGVWVASLQNVSIPGATLTLTLVNDGEVEIPSTTNGAGQTTFFNLPSNSSMRMTASAPGYRPWTFDVMPWWTGVNVWLERANNDFSQTLAEWTVSTSRAFVLPHSEPSQSLVLCPDCVGRNLSASGELTAANASSDMDLVIDTKNLLGPQTVSRRFTVAPGTSQVTVRYRFQTDEIFTAYPKNGSFRNDSYTVTLRSVTTGLQVHDTQTVGSLFGSFDVNAATPWQTRTLAITSPNELVELTLTVANAIDNAHMSLLYADLLQETTYRVTKVALRDLISTDKGYPLNGSSGVNDPYAASRPAEDKPLKYLSASPHSIYDGFVRIHGAIEISGPANGSLREIYLDVLENGVVKATGTLARTAISTVRDQLLNRAFGPQAQLSVQVSTTGITPVLFEIPSGQLSNLNQSVNDRSLRLRVRAQRTDGIEIDSFEVPGTVIKLVKYSESSSVRFGDRDSTFCTGLDPGAARLQNRPPFPCGGDSWTEPATKQWAEGLTNMTWNDFSNMNGGFFPFHAGHKEGRTIDGLFPGFVNRDAAAAQKLLDLLQQHSSRIERILVGVSVDRNCNATAVNPNHPFWKVIFDAPPLPDGQLPRSLILNAGGHCGHFDVKLKQ